MHDLTTLCALLGEPAMRRPVRLAGTFPTPALLPLGVPGIAACDAGDLPKPPEH